MPFRKGRNVNFLKFYWQMNYRCGFLIGFPEIHWLLKSSSSSLGNFEGEKICQLQYFCDKSNSFREEQTSNLASLSHWWTICKLLNLKILIIYMKKIHISLTEIFWELKWKNPPDINVTMNSNYYYHYVIIVLKHW